MSVETYIADAKKHLKSFHDVKSSFNEVKDHMKREVETLQDLRAQGKSAIPELSYAQVESGSVSAAQIDDIKHRGCVIVRGVYSEQQANDWNAQMGDYIESNDYIEKSKAKAGMDTYFADLDAGAPQIYGLYWSRPQMEARQGASMAETKSFLNRLWDVSGPMGDEFDPDQDFTYADRTRRRSPGDTTLGLSPHMDAGSYERWVDAAFQKIYEPIFKGAWKDYDPWKATYRTQTREFESPAVCSMFRTFQGWTALTAQGPDDGTLSVLPLAHSISYFLLRALQDDVADDDLCGAQPGRALGATEKWHSDIMPGIGSIPLVNPGDTVWWHPDIIHSVANEHNGKDFANVIYIGASPKCPKNEAYAKRQAQHFLAGKSGPDFAAEDYEVDFKGRFTEADLSDLGRKQMGLA